MKFASLVAVAGLTWWLPVSSSAPLQRSAEPVYEPGDGVTTPVLVHEVKPAYSPTMMRERRQGQITLEGVVRPNGGVTDIQVVRSLDPEADRIAREAFAKWEFKPGTKDGSPVSVRIEVAVAFTLRDGADPDPVYRPGSNVASPVIETEVKPTYPDDAHDAGVRGEVRLECVVRRDGMPTDIVVTKGVHPSLDQAAIVALKQWRFKPGMSNGKPVSVRIQLMMSFDLK